MDEVTRDLPPFDEAAQKCWDDGHDWTPWLKITDRSWVTTGGRCGHQEQWDG